MAIKSSLMSLTIALFVVSGIAYCDWLFVRAYFPKIIHFRCAIRGKHCECMEYVRFPRFIDTDQHLATGNEINFGSLKRSEVFDGNVVELHTDGGSRTELAMQITNVHTMSRPLLVGKTLKKNVTIKGYTIPTDLSSNRLALQQSEE